MPWNQWSQQNCSREGTEKVWGCSALHGRGLWLHHTPQSPSLSYASLQPSILLPSLISISFHARPTKADPLTVGLKLKHEIYRVTSSSWKHLGQAKYILWIVETRMGQIRTKFLFSCLRCLNIFTLSCPTSMTSYILYTVPHQTVHHLPLRKSILIHNAMRPLGDLKT